MEKHVNVGMSGPKVLNSDLTIQASYRAFPTLASMMSRALALDRLKLIAGTGSSGLRPGYVGPGREVDIISGCFWIVRRKALEDVGPMDEAFFMYAEDKDWCLRFWRAGWKVVYLPEAEAIHFGGRSSGREPVRFYVEMHRANLRYWAKHYGWLSNVMAVVIMFLHQVVRIAACLVAFPFVSRGRSRVREVIRRSVACARFLLGGEWHLNAK